MRTSNRHSSPHGRIRTTASKVDDLTQDAIRQLQASETRSPVSLSLESIGCSPRALATEHTPSCGVNDDQRQLVRIRLELGTSRRFR